MTIPGISFYSGLSIIGEIGNIQRFNSARKLTAFAGLNPSVSQSGDKCYYGHIAKRGNKNLRWMLNQCANIAIMHDSTLSKIYHRIKNEEDITLQLQQLQEKCYVLFMLCLCII